METRARKRLRLMADERGETSGSAQPENNPLLIDVVVKRVFHHIDARELNKNRLVCKTWDRAARLNWEKINGPVVITRGDYTPLGFGRMNFGPSSDLQRLKPRKMLEFLKQTREHPDSLLADYRNFYLLGWRFRQARRPQCLMTFWRIFGGWMTTLKLDFYEASNLKRLLEVLQCRLTPNLHTLDFTFDAAYALRANTMIIENFEGEHTSLRSLRLATYETLIPFPFNWTALFNYYPNLMDLKLGHSMRLEVEGVLEAIGGIRGVDATKCDLKSISWFDKDFTENYWSIVDTFHFGQMSNLVANLFQNARLNLESLSFRFTNELEENAVHRAITCQAATLKRLAFYRNEPFKELPLAGMTNLTYIYMRGCPFRDLSFLRQIQKLPHLQTLDLQRDHGSFSNEFEPVFRSAWKIKLPSLRQFNCDYFKDPLDPKQVTIMRKWTPNLTHLELRLTNASFREVCQKWPSLEHLGVYGDEVDERGILGIYHKSGKLQGINGKPNITNLKKLRSFKLDTVLGMWIPLPKGVFTRKSVDDGFLMLPRLQKLEIRCCGISNDDKQLLEKEIPFVNLIIQSTSNAFTPM